MKISIVSTAIVCLTTLSSFAQNNEVEFAGRKTPYKLDVPQGWTAERSELTAKISINGVEDLRLTPGWNNSKSEDYWTYASVWTLDNATKIDAGSIKNDLTVYYTDLLIKNIKKYKVPGNKILQIKTWMNELESEVGDLKTYYGAVSMLDFKTQTPISLNCFVHVRSCPGQSKTFVLYELSPKPLNHVVWKSLDKLSSGFACVPTQPYSSN